MRGKSDEALLKWRFGKIISLPHILVLDQDLRVESVDPDSFEFFNRNPDEAVGRQLYDICHEQWNIVELRHLLEELLAKNNYVEEYPVRHRCANIGRQTLHLSALRTLFADNRVRILLAFCDAKERAIGETRSSEDLRYGGMTRSDLLNHLNELEKENQRLRRTAATLSQRARKSKKGTFPMAPRPGTPSKLPPK
jgi:hypothetical protein